MITPAPATSSPKVDSAPPELSVAERDVKPLLAGSDVTLPKMSAITAVEVPLISQQEMVDSLRAHAAMLAQRGSAKMTGFAGMFAHILANNIARSNPDQSRGITPQQFVEIAQQSGIDGQTIVKLAHEVTSVPFSAAVIDVFARSMTLTPFAEAKASLYALIMKN